MNLSIPSSIATVVGLAVYGAAMQDAKHLSVSGFDWGLIQPEFIPLLIFGLRTIGMTLSTLRMLAVVRGRRVTAWVLGLAQAVLFITSITGVLGNLQNVWNLVAYAAGIATGSVLGIAIEGRLAPGHSLLRVTSARRGNAIIEALHWQDYGATVVFGQGQEGTVGVVFCYVPRRRVEQVRRRVIDIDAEAFMTVEHVRQVRGGWRA